MNKSSKSFIFVEENKNNLTSKGPWWRLGIEVFSKVSTWIVFPVIIALIIGKSLDKYYGTKPWIFLGFTGMAFFVSAYGIIQVAMKYAKNIEKENKDSWKNKNKTQ